MSGFKPRRVFFEPRALEYSLGKSLFEYFKKAGVETLMTTSHNQVRGIPGKTFQQRYFNAKQTMVVGVRGGLEFQTSKPSADYALPLVTGCPGHCEYCYLNTNLGTRSYIRVYVNIEEILERARRYIEAGGGSVVTFEGSCTSDPLVVEEYTHGLAKSIEFFGGQENGRFRWVTKFDHVSPILALRHNGHTHVRFSVNADYVIRKFERAVPSLDARLDAAAEVARAGYPLGFILGPIFVFDGWREGYRGLFRKMSAVLPAAPNLTFELITHRFTPRAKNVILDVYPNTELPMEEGERQFKWGQFGYGKYVYQKEDMKKLSAFFEDEVHAHFSGAVIEYFV